MGQSRHSSAFKLSTTEFLLCAALIYGLIAILLVYLAALFTQNIWAIGDTRLFYRMAGVIVSGGVPYVDFVDPKPPLIYFTLTLPLLLGQKLFGGLALVGICNFASSLLIMGMGWKLYGRWPGFAAGLLFLLNMALAEGFFILTEPFTLAFILLSAYGLLFLKSDKKYFISGVCAGIAIGFKQYAILAIPLALFFMYRNKELKGATAFIIGALLPVLAMFGAIFLIYGANAGTSSLYWSFGVADTYLTQGSIGNVPAYRAPDLAIAAADILLEAGLFITLFTLALAGALADRVFTPAEEFLLLSGAAFLSMLAVRQYLHYWALALPFIILFCVRAYRHRKEAFSPD
jgi:4-amino-4-deoxy-L-arabinose transferase-like glycosyltransferase